MEKLLSLSSRAIQIINKVFENQNEISDQSFKVKLNKNLNEGVYILSVVTGTGIYSKKVIVGSSW